MNGLLVTVVIPTFNRADTIGDAIDSVLSQTYPDIEIIVVDDGSTDNTPELLTRYGDSIRVIRQANAGPSAARNKGANAGKGELIAFLDSDDKWLPEKTSQQVELIDLAGANTPCCVCNAVATGMNGSEPYTSFEVAGIRMLSERGLLNNPLEVLATRFLLFNQAVLIRRKAFERVGGFNTDLVLLEDYEIAMKLAKLGAWGLIQAPLVDKRNDTEGIGVRAMREPIRHFEARCHVLEGLLKEHIDPKTVAGSFIQKSLLDVKSSLRAHRLVKSRVVPKCFYGAILLSMIRLKTGLSRRLPGWPKPDISYVVKLHDAL